MRDCLLLCGKGDVDYLGGLLSDVTYRFFHNGYLLTTSMYNEHIMRWVPVLYTCIFGLETTHYQAHFTTLLKIIKTSDLTEPAKAYLTRQVVDFSLAQKNGFIAAYLDVSEERDRDRALSKLKGCHEHFRAAITHVKRNRAVVPAAMEVSSSFFFTFLSLEMVSDL